MPADSRSWPTITAFVTKYRRGALTDPILDDYQEVMADVCRDFGAELSKFNGEDDHLHLLIK